MIIHAWFTARPGERERLWSWELVGAFVFQRHDFLIMQIQWQSLIQILRGSFTKLIQQVNREHIGPSVCLCVCLSVCGRVHQTPWFCTTGCDRAQCCEVHQISVFSMSQPFSHQIKPIVYSNGTQRPRKNHSLSLRDATATSSSRFGNVLHLVYTVEKRFATENKVFLIGQVHLVPPCILPFAT